MNLPTSPVIQIENLRKEFNFKAVLADVNLEVHPGHIVGLLGANGSGKSTLLRHMIGLYLPNSGSCTTLGCDAAKLTPKDLARIGYVHQEGSLVDWMRVYQMVDYVAAYYPSWNRDLEREYFSTFKLDQSAAVGTLSPGQRQMLAILLAIGFEPELLILDEPAAALDPLARQRFLDLLLGIIQDPDRTILISSHILSDVEKVIDHVIILDQGKIQRDVSFDDLREEFTKIRLMALEGSLPDPLPFGEPLSCERNGSEAVLVVPSVARQQLEQMARTIHSSTEVLPLPLEEIYGLVLSASSGEGGPSA